MTRNRSTRLAAPILAALLVACGNGGGQETDANQRSAPAETTTPTACGEGSG